MSLITPMGIGKFLFRTLPTTLYRWTQTQENTIAVAERALATTPTRLDQIPKSPEPSDENLSLTSTIFATPSPSFRPTVEFKTPREFGDAIEEFRLDLRMPKTVEDIETMDAKLSGLAQTFQVHSALEQIAKWRRQMQSVLTQELSIDEFNSTYYKRMRRELTRLYNCYWIVSEMYDDPFWKTPPPSILNAREKLQAPYYALDPVTATDYLAPTLRYLQPIEQQFVQKFLDAIEDRRAVDKNIMIAFLNWIILSHSGTVTRQMDRIVIDCKKSLSQGMQRGTLDALKAFTADTPDLLPTVQAIWEATNPYPSEENDE